MFLLVTVRLFNVDMFDVFAPWISYKKMYVIKISFVNTSCFRYK